MDWDEWAARRPAGPVLHLDSAAAGRSSLATLDATAAHARLAAEVGAYVAQEQQADVLDQLRTDVAALLGVPPGGVAFVESATEGLERLLRAWPLRVGDRVGVVGAEWGPNLELLVHHGLELVDVPVEGSGRLDLDAFARLLAADPPAVVHLTQVASHRGLVQPVAEAATLCRGAGVLLWVDAAQAIGHVGTATGADAIYATSRKWLTGPRGVGMLGVAEWHWDDLDVLRMPMQPSGQPAPSYLESHEANVAGRIGLANAVREYLAVGVETMTERLDEVGRLTRAVLAEVPGWAVVGDDTSRGAITALRPTAGQDVAATRATLLAEDGIVTTAGATARAPRDMREPLLRISPHADCTEAGLERLCAALAKGN